MRLLKKPAFIIAIAALSFVGLGFMSEHNSSMASNLESTANVNIGDKAPEIAINDSEGNVRKLSDLKGKIVLLDFWASWCGPCRRENPNVVRVYDKFKDAKFKNADGFEIFSVSLDKSSSKWLAAIKKDNLKWENHVCDFKGWASSGVATYNVTGIPKTFLIDEEGTILASGLRGAALENSLKRLLK